MFKKREKTPAKPRLLENAIVYTDYTLSLGERLLCLLGGFVAGAVVGYIFYASILIAALAGALLCPFAPRAYRNMRVAQQLRALKLQFKDFLESMATSIGAGRNISDSLIASYDDLKFQYSPHAIMVREVEQIIAGMNNNINIEALLFDLASRSGNDDIVSFANVFETCYRKGGNMREVIKTTHQIINDKMEIDMEIQTMTTSAKNELNLMTVAPVVFVFVLRSMGGGLSGQGTAASVMATTIALVMFTVAYFVGAKIMTIKI